MSYYLTQQDYETAEKNGINAKRVYQRVHQHNWSIERAITQPVISPQNIWEQWKEVAKKNRIKRNTFYYRVRDQGMSPEQAASEIVKEPSIPEWAYEKAKEHGVSRFCLRMRVFRYNWSLEEASSTPPLPTGISRKVQKKRGGWK